MKASEVSQWIYIFKWCLVPEEKKYFLKVKIILYHLDIIFAYIFSIIFNFNNFGLIQKCKNNTLSLISPQMLTFSMFALSFFLFIHSYYFL